MHLYALPERDRPELLLGHVRAQREGVQIGDAIQRLSGLHHFSGLHVRRENGACLGIGDFTLDDTVPDLRDARRRRRNLTAHAALLCACRLDLRRKHAVVALRQIQLLRRSRLLIEQATRALVRTPRDTDLGLVHGHLSRRGRLACLRRATLRDRLRAFEVELRRIHDSDDDASGELSAFDRRKPTELSARLRGHDDLARLEVAVRVGWCVALATGSEHHAERSADRARTIR